MKTLRAAFLLVTAFPVPCAAQQPKSAPVVVLVAPGISHIVVKEYLDRGVLPRDGGFAGLMRDGVLAPLVPLYSPETGPSRASLWTGAQPSSHGIVGNSFRIEGESLARGTGSFDTPLLAETVLDAARRAGKRVIRLIDWPPSSIEQVGSLDFTPKTLSNPTVLPVEVPARTSQGTDAPHEAALDMTLLDKSRVQLELQFSGTKRRIRFSQAGRAGRWAEFKESWAFVRLPSGVAGAWIKLIAGKSSGASAQKVSLFVGSLVEQTNHPALREFERANGPAPGRAPSGLVRSGRVDDATWWEHIRRLHTYNVQLGIHVMQRVRPDLLLVDLSWIDSAFHVLALEDPRQAAYEAEGGAKRKRFAAYTEEAYRLLDGAITNVRKALPRGTRLVVASDHGMMPAHTSIPLQKLFEQLGWEADTVRVYESISSAHIYVAPSRVNDLAKLEEFCRAITDPATGERVIEEVHRGAALGPLGFGGPRAGDVWVMAKPGYEISSEPKADWGPASFTGLHGFRDSYPRNVGVLGMVGGDIRSQSGKSASVLDVAATLRDLLGIPAAKQGAGKSVLQE